jgi:hypothetical protein
VLEKRVKSRIFGAKREEVIGQYCKLHNESHYLYISLNIGRMKWVGHVTYMEEMLSTKF